MHCLRWYRVPLYTQPVQVGLSPTIDSFTREFGKKSDKGVMGTKKIAKIILLYLKNHKKSTIHKKCRTKMTKKIITTMT